MPITRTSSLVTVKTASTAGPVNKGDVITFTMAVTNTGNTTLTNVTVSDSLSGLSTVSPASVASLAPGITTNFTATYTVTQADIDGTGSIANTASATAKDPANATVTSGTSTATVTVNRSPALTLTKTSNATATTAVGSTIIYTFTVKNTGNVTLNTVTISDDLAGVTGAWTPVTLAPGATTTFTGSYILKQSDIDAGQLVNVARATGKSVSGGGTVTSPDATRTDTFTRSPGIKVVKSADLSTASKGDLITFTMVVTNIGNVSLTNITVADTLVGISVVNPTSVANLAPAASAIFKATYIVTQADIDGTGSIVNSATASAKDPTNTTVTSPSSIATVALVRTNALTLTKTSDATAATTAGSVITYTFTVKNTGNVTITGVAITDDLAGVGATTPASVSTLAPGASTTFTASYTVTQANVDAGQVVNVARAKGTSVSGGGTVTSPDATRTDLLTRTPGILLTKTSNLTGTLILGQTITYSFTVKNTGNVTLTSVSVADPLVGLSSITPASVATLAPGATTTFTATYVTTQADVDSGTLSNTATAGGNPPTGSRVTSSSTLELPLNQSPSIGITKTSNASANPKINDVITYTFDVINSGNVTLKNVSVTDTHSGLSAISPASVATLLPGAHATFTATYVVTQSDVDAGKIVNSATAKGTTPKSVVITSIPSSLTVTIPQTGTLLLTKTASAPAPGAIVVGSTISYTFTVKNTGNVTLHDLNVTDILSGISAISPATLSTLAPGATTTFSATYTVTQSDINNGSVGNTATAHAKDPANSAVDSNTSSTTTAITRAPSISIDKSAAFTSPLIRNRVITYTFTVQNTGNVTLTNIVVTDPLPGLGTISPNSVTSLLPGATATFTASYTVTQTDVNTGSIVNTARVTSKDPTNTAITNTDDLTLPIVRTPALSLTKSADKSGELAVGSVITYTFVATNSGNVTLSSVKVTDTLSGLGAVSPASAGPLDPGASATFTATYTVTQADINRGFIDNAATATAKDPAAATVTSPTATNRVTINQHPSLTLAKSASAPAPGSIIVGSTITYTFLVTNTGNVTLTSVKPIDTHSGLSAFNPTSSTLLPGNSTSFTATYTVSQADIDNGAVANTAHATGLTPSLVSVNSTDSSANVPITRNPKMTLAKSNNVTGQVIVGQTVTYTYVVVNTGNVTLSGLGIIDPHTGLSAISPLSVGTLLPGGNATFTATYVVKQSDIDAGQVLNTAHAAATAPGTGPMVSPDASNTITIIRNSALTIAKSSNATGATKKGDTITYSFLVTNTGNVTLSGVTVTDGLSGLSAISPASITLAPLGTQTFTATYVVKQSDIDAGTIHNSATASGTSLTGTTTSLPSTLDVTLAQTRGITLTKSASATAPVVLGSVISYSFLVTNTGNTTLSTVSITDPMFTSGQISPTTAATLAPGASTTFTASHTVVQNDVDAGAIDNTATASGTAPGSIPVPSSPSSAHVPVQQTKSLLITKTSDATAATKKGDTITFTLTVKNTGTVTQTNIKATDLLANVSAVSPVNVASLNPNATTTFTATYVVTQADIDAGVIHNSAKATGTPLGTSQTTTSNTASLDVNLTRSSSMTLVKNTSTTGAIVLGQTVTFTFQVTNTGNTTLANIAVTDNLAGVATVLPASWATLAPGAVANFTATYVVTAADVEAGTIHNTASAIATKPDSSTITTNASFDLAVARHPGLSLTKTANPALPVVVGQTITYTFTVKNTGDVTLFGLTIADEMGGVSATTPTTVGSLRAKRQHHADRDLCGHTGRRRQRLDPKHCIGIGSRQ